MQRLKQRACIVVFLLLWSGISLAGCSQFFQSLALSLTPSPSPFWPTGTVAETSSSAPSLIETQIQDIDCVFVWSNRTLPDVSTEVNQAFRNEGLSEVMVEASAYGEDCLDPTTNQVVHFTATQTDFYINVVIDRSDNPQMMGEWVERIIRALQSFPPGVVPGPNPGYIGISFINGPETISLWFARSKGESLVKEGLKGGELYNVLSGP